MSNHEYTYCFRLNGNTLYISGRIGIEKLFMSYFFILMLRYPHMFTHDGFENIQVFLNSVHEKSSKFSKPSKTITASKVMTRNQSKMSTLKKMLYNVWLGESKVFYYNDNYVLSTFVSNKKTYVMKCCDLENYFQDAIKEFRNESEILQHHHQILGKK